MDERLRLSYLAAMDIPVWLVRDAQAVPVEEVVEQAGARQPAVEPSAASDAVPSAREQMHAVMATDTPGARRMQGTAAPARAASREFRTTAPALAADRVELLLARAASTLFIAAAPEPGAAARVLDLLGAIGSALEGVRVTPEAQLFSWPPRNAVLDAGQARDAVLGLMSKLQQAGGYVRVVLMGEAGAALMLGWSRAQYRARKPQWQAAQGVDTPMLVTHAAAELLDTPGLKAATWRELRMVLDG